MEARQVSQSEHRTAPGYISTLPPPVRSAYSNQAEIDSPAVQNMPNNSRYAAIESLTRVDRTRLPLSNIFDRVAQECALNQKDRQLAMKISCGVLRNRDYLGQVISILCNRPTRKIKPFVYHALEAGLFQLLLLDRIPPPAAVNETIKALQQAGFPKQLRGFVNGVLRQCLRRKDDLPTPDSLSDDGQPFLNHPVWLTARWQSRYGSERMKRICATNNIEPTLCLRVNSSIGSAHFMDMLNSEGIMAIPGRYVPEALLLPGYRGLISSIPGYDKGYFQVQDQASQLAVLLLAPFRQGLRYLDCCAGLGGKTCHLGALLEGGHSLLTAVEPDPGRYRLLRENVRRFLGSQKLSLHNEPLDRFARTCQVRFDGVIVDAPCSGTGVIGRQPDIRWNREEHELAVFQGKQRLLLDTAAELLTPGGILVYSTCSIEPEENFQVIDDFLSSDDRFQLSDCTSFLPQSASALVHEKCLAPLPDEDIDGFFAARLTKRRASN